jgi:GntR family histidine utilization transcriptional repressor
LKEDAKKKGSLHDQIRREIEARIMSGEWPAGHKIPVELELMHTYGCSRMTVNKALQALIQAGLLESRKRAGTFVGTPRLHRAALEIPDIRTEVMEQGRLYRLQLQSRALRKATDADDALLQGADGEVLALTCRHFAADAPYALEYRLINLVAVPDARTVDFSSIPPGSWLLDHVPWTEAEHRISAINPTPQEAEWLGIGPGVACLALERWTWRGNDRITYVRQIYPGDRHALVAHFKA